MRINLSFMAIPLSPSRPSALAGIVCARTQDRHFATKNDITENGNEVTNAVR